ncbi:MAG: M20/M25/M40 family metallo-hydrolase [Blastocatellia bacterium]|nr:M20/M25/M40 family metallo-hydrolase [Blastocatellia bacterium]
MFITKIYSFILVISFILSVSAQKPQVADTVEQNLRKHVEYLSSDKLEGRRTGEQGATFAAGYVSNMFAQYKLKAGHRGTNGKPNFLQPFPYVAGVNLGPENLLRIVPADSANENKMEIGVNWMPLGYSQNGDIAASQVVFAGFGIVSEGLKYDDYAGLDVKDKIVLVFDGNPDAGNPHSEFGRFNIHTKASIARDKGARAILVIASESDFKSDRLAALSYDRTLGETAIPVVALMRSHGAELLGAGNEKALAEIERSIAIKKDTTPSVQFKIANPLNATARLKIDLAKRQTEAYNVIGILEGNDPLLKNEAIVIGAHYDHLGKGGQGSLAVNSNEIHHGADDNASGTSAILELARQFAKEKKNKRTIIFIAFGGEEEGLLGSKYFVNNPVWPLDKIVTMINLDMVGRLQGKLTIG